MRHRAPDCTPPRARTRTPLRRNIATLVVAALVGAAAVVGSGVAYADEAVPAPADTADTAAASTPADGAGESVAAGSDAVQAAPTTDAAATEPVADAERPAAGEGGAASARSMASAADEQSVAASVVHTGTAYPYAGGGVYYVPATVTAGEPIHLSGTGWLNTAGTAGSVIGIKLDEGGVSTKVDVVNPATGAVQPNKTIYGVVQADAAGEWQIDIPWPTLENSTVAWAAGETHSVRFLTGSLLTGDVIRTAAASLTVTPPKTAPTVTAQPSAASVQAGADATFAASAAGYPTPSVQWQSAQNGSAWTDVAGATSSTLTVSKATGPQTGASYRAVFTNEVGSVASDAATLTVTVPTTLTVPQTLTGGADITISGTGWLNKANTAGSVIGIKLDEGSVSTKAVVTNPANGQVQANKTIYALVQADATGAWTATFPFPTLENANVAWSVGETHSVRLLTGSLLADDQGRSQTASFTVAAVAPTVTAHPANTTVKEGADATFTASAGGWPAPAMQWQSSADGSTWADVPGATEASHTVAAPAATQSGTQYRAVFANEGGSAPTNAAMLTVVPSGAHQGSTDPSATFTVPPRVVAGETITISGTGWTNLVGTAGSVVGIKLDGVSTKAAVTNPATGLVVANKTISAIAQADTAGNWTATLPFPTLENSTVAWAAGETHSVTLLTGSLLTGDKVRSESASFIVAAAPTVTTQPVDAAVTAGADAVFTASADGSPAPSIRWQSSPDGQTWTDIAGATAKTLTLAKTTGPQTGTHYRAVFTNELGSVASDAATLTVTVPVEPVVTLNVPTQITAGEDITISGTGWTNTAGTAGSVVGIKLDEGGVSTTATLTNPATGASVANKTIYAIAQADADGTWTATFPFPTLANSTQAWAAGQTHSVRVLSGSLLAGDKSRSESASFTVAAKALTCPEGQLLVSDTAGGQTATACVQQHVSTDGGATVTVTGAGWLTTDGTAGADVVLKLTSRTSSTGTDFQFVRTGSDILNHPVSGVADATMWVLAKADATGAFATTFAVPAAANVPANIGPSGELKAGGKLVVHFQTGLRAIDTVHSFDSPALVVDGVPYAGDQDGAVTACVADGPAEVHIEAPAGTDAATGPTVVFGGTVRLVGSGFCNSDPAKGGSVIGLKIDEGAFSHLPSEIVNANATIWQIIAVDSADGSFAVDVTLPTASGAGSSTPAFTLGTHTLRLLTGSLKAGDPIRTLETGPFTVGAYQPNGVPDPIDAATLTAATAGGVSTALTESTLVVTVPGAQQGDWIFVTPFLADGSPRYPWTSWYRADAQGRVTLPLAGVTLPVGTVKVAAQSGNAGEVGTLLGWASLTIATPPATGGGPVAVVPTADAGAPAAAAPAAPRSRATVTATRATITATAPTNVPAAPFSAGDGLDASNAGGVTGVQDGTVVTLTLPNVEPGAWVYLYAYSAPIAVGWIQVDANRQVRIDIAPLPAGDHKIAVLSEDGALVGWAAATVAGAEAVAVADATTEDSAGEVAAQSAAGTSGEAAAAGGPSAADWWLLGGGAFVVLAGLAVALIVASRRRAGERPAAAGEEVSR